MNGKKRTAINMIAQLANFIVGLAINFFLAPYITEYIGKEIYGYVSLANTVTSYVMILTLALNAMLNRYVTINLQQGNIKSANHYYSSVAISNIVGSIILIAPISVMVIFLDKIINIPKSSLLDIKLLWVFIFISFIINLATGVFGTAMFAKNRLDIAAKRDLGVNIIKGVILFGLFALFPAKVWFVGFATLFSAIYFIITSYYYKNKLAPELKILKKYFRWKTVKEMVSVGVWNSVNQLTQILLNGLDLLIANLFIDPLSMGLMSFSKIVPVQLLSLISIVSNTFSPQMTLTYADGDINKFTNEVKYIIKICGFLCSVPILGFLAFGHNFFSLWLGTLSAPEIDTIQILSILTLFPTIFSVYFFPLYNVNMITCKLKIPVLVSLGIGIINLISVFILLKTTTLGIISIKLVSSILLFLRVVVFTPIYAANNLKVKWSTFYPPLLRGFTASISILIIYYVIQYFISIHSWITLIAIACFAGVIGYIVNYFIVFSIDDRKKIKMLLFNKLRRI